MTRNDVPSTLVRSMQDDHPFNMRAVNADPELRKHVGARIREARITAGLSQNALARLIPDESVSSQYVSRWERGENMPSWQHLKELAAALGVTIGWLIENGPS